MMRLIIVNSILFYKNAVVAKAHNQHRHRQGVTQEAEHNSAVTSRQQRFVRIPPTSGLERYARTTIQEWV